MDPFPPHDVQVCKEDRGRDQDEVSAETEERIT